VWLHEPPERLRLPESWVPLQPRLRELGRRRFDELATSSSLGPDIGFSVTHSAHIQWRR
jgi:hypothetical protein